MSRQSRYKPTGWRGEPHRHYLAAKGIKTRYNADKYGMWAHKRGHGMMAHKGLKGPFPENSRVYVDAEGTVLAYEDLDSGYADAVDDEMLREAERKGGIFLQGDEPGEFEKKEMHSDNKVMEDVPDLAMDVKQDMDFSSDFRLRDAAVMPGSLVKDAGNAIGDMVRFASDVTRK